MTRLQRVPGQPVSDGEEALVTQIKWLNLPAPVREHPVAPGVRRWRFDFAWPSLMVAVEVEGGIRSGGRHTRSDGFDADCEKYAEAAIAGWSVIRVSTGMVTDGRAVALVERLLRSRMR